MIEAVLFDIGDTLVHFETVKATDLLTTAIRPAYEYLGGQGLALPPYAAYLGSIRRAFLWAYLWSRLTQREVRLSRVLERAHARMGLVFGEARLSELAGHSTAALRRYMTRDTEAVDLVRRIADAGLKLGIVSNTVFPAFAIDDHLRDEGLLDFFPVRIYSSDVRYMKPHRRIFRAALAQLGVPADRAVFVGDRVDKDVKGSARVGMKTVLLSRNGRVPSGRWRPDHVVQRLGEIGPILGV